MELAGGPGVTPEESPWRQAVLGDWEGVTEAPSPGNGRSQEDQAVVN